MTATFPGGVKSFTTKYDNVTDVMAEHVNSLQDEVVAIETELRKTSGSVVDHGSLAGLSDNDHPQYLLTTGKAADADKLDNIDSAGFVQTSGNQTVAGIKTFSSIPVLPASNPTTANEAVRKGFADATYLGITAKAADADKLDGLDSTDFVLASGLGTATAYTPIWTASTSNPTLGDGTLQGRYIQVGKLVVVFINFVFGSTSSFGVGNHYLSLPFEAQSSGGGKFDGFARFRDEGIANYFRIAGIATTLSSTQITLFVSLTGNDNNWTPTSPFSMASGDNLVIQLMYERT